MPAGLHARTGCDVAQHFWLLEPLLVNGPLQAAGVPSLSSS